MEEEYFENIERIFPINQEIWGVYSLDGKEVEYVKILAFGKVVEKRNNSKELFIEFKPLFLDIERRLSIFSFPKNSLQGFIYSDPNKLTNELIIYKLKKQI